MQRSDFNTDKFKEIQSKAETTVQNLRPHEEYKEFIEKYKLVSWINLSLGYVDPNHQFYSIINSIYAYIVS